MILSRISRALKDQNWLAVGIEFVIVVAGVMLAFQVTQFSQDHAEAQRRAVALDRLHDEVETSTGVLMMFVRIYEELNTDRTEALERLQAGDFDGMDEEAMTDALVALALFPAFSPPEGVYNEIVTSGMLSGLGDTTFRDALSRYQSSVVFLQGQIDYFRLLSTAEPGMDSFPSVWLEFDPASSRGRRHIVDWLAAADDPDLYQHVLNGNNRMRAMESWWRDTLDAALALCAETARLTDQACEPEGPHAS